VLTVRTVIKEPHKEQVSHLHYEKTLTITIYSLPLPWNKNLGNCQQAQNAIALTSRTINNADSVC